MGWFFCAGSRARATGRAVFRWILSAIAFCGLLFAGTLQGVGNWSACSSSVVCGLFLAIVWCRITDFVGGSSVVYDGGTMRSSRGLFIPSRRPGRNSSTWKRWREIRRAVDKISRDFEGSMMLRKSRPNSSMTARRELTIQRPLRIRPRADEYCLRPEHLADGI